MTDICLEMAGKRLVNALIIRLHFLFTFWRAPDTLINMFLQVLVSVLKPADFQDVVHTF